MKNLLSLGLCALALTTSPSIAAQRQDAVQAEWLQTEQGPKTEAGPEINGNGTVNFVDHVGIDQNLGEALDLRLPFQDETGKQVLLGEYFDDRPVVLVLAYYECPMLCTLVLNGMTKSLRTILDLDIGKDFEVVVVSIDPEESPELAAETKANYVEFYNDLNEREGSEEGWHFLVGSQKSIDAISSQVGFRYVYDPETDEYAHASGIVIATPKGRLSGYFYGIEYITKDVRLGLIEAGKGTIGSLADMVLLLCYHYDPTTGKYGLAIMGILRFLGVLTVLVLAFSIVRMARSDRSSQSLAVGGSLS